MRPVSFGCAAERKTDAFRWKRQLTNGTASSFIPSIVRTRKPDRSFVGDILWLTLLAPKQFRCDNHPVST